MQDAGVGEKWVIVLFHNIYSLEWIQYLIPKLPSQRIIRKRFPLNKNLKLIKFNTIFKPPGMEDQVTMSLGTLAPFMSESDANSFGSYQASKVSRGIGHQDQ